MTVWYMTDMSTGPVYENRGQLHRNMAEETLVHVPRALVIDPSPRTGPLIQQAIASLSFIGVVESRSDAALQRYARLNPAIVFIDLDLPDLTGWEILDVLKEARSDGQRPIIIVMATPDSPATRIMGRLQGVDGRLVKPFTPTDIQKVVHDALTARRHAGEMLPSALLRRVPPRP